MDDVTFPGWQPEKSIHVITGEEMTRVFVKGQPYMSWQSGDEGCLRLAIVQLYQCGLGTEEELCSVPRFSRGLFSGGLGLKRGVTLHWVVQSLTSWRAGILPSLLVESVSR